ADDLSTETDLSGFLETNPDYEQILSELNESNLIIPDFKEKSNENIF
ncbi:5216_t:CDS:1, partial [Gigaspora margarita]